MAVQELRLLCWHLVITIKMVMTMMTIKMMMTMIKMMMTVKITMMMVKIRMMTVKMTMMVTAMNMTVMTRHDICHKHHKQRLCKIVSTQVKFHFENVILEQFMFLSFWFWAIYSHAN